MGAQLPNRVYRPPVYFADQDWRKPNRAAYMAALAEYHPHMATVLDWERAEQWPEVLDWAAEAAQFVAQVLIVPKVIGGRIGQLPRRIDAAEVVLAYSVPTKFAGTSVPQWEFTGWPVHLLGGSPHAQMRLARYLNVTSADGNMANRMAMRGQFWSGDGLVSWAHDPRWPTLGEADGSEWGHDAIYEAFRRSCMNIMASWQGGIF